MSGLIFIAFVFHLLTSLGTAVAGERLPHEPEMVEIPGGSFQMGCVSGRDCVDWEHPVHEVRVEGFELSRYEVTFEEYDRFTEATGRAPAVGTAWERGGCSLRVMRGGSLVSDPGSLRSAYRLGYTTAGTFGIGIRLARTISP